MRKAYIAIVVFVLVLISNVTHAVTTADGLAWLTSIQNTTSGNWGEDDLAILNTTESLNILHAYAINTTSYTLGVSWLDSQQYYYDWDDLSRMIYTLSTAGVDVSGLSADLIEVQTEDGGWGASLEYNDEPNPLDTALALSALMKAGAIDPASADAAVAYLLSTQKDNGSWGYNDIDDGFTVVTATVLSSLKPYAAYSQVSTALTLAQSYLLAHQNADGGFGSSPSTVYETALALEALSGRTTDATVLGNARAYLESTQSTEGSWNSDPYSTALALRALSISEDVPAPEAPTTGAITGRAVDAMTGQPLGSVEISSLEVQGTTWTSKADGGFTIELPEGRYTFSFAHAGYITSSLSVNIASGELVSIGSVAMAVPVTTSNIVGKVTEAASGLPLAGARVELSGAHLANTVTAEDGSYTFLTLTPGTVTLAVSAEGYYSVQGSAELIAGVNLNFSPSLTRVASGGEGGGNVPLTTIKGLVVDGTGGSPVEGAAVTSGSKVGTTLADGSFEFEVVPGAQGFSITKDGYAPASANISVPEGVAYNMGTIRLYAVPTVGSVKVNVYDSTSGAALAGAEVALSGTTSMTVYTGAEGSAEFMDVLPGTAVISVSAADYHGATKSLEVAAGGVEVVDLAMAYMYGTITGRVVDQATGQPIKGASLQVEGTPAMMSDTAGMFTIIKVAPGTYQVDISAVGYTTQTYSVAIMEGAVTSFGDIRLAPIPVTSTLKGTVTEVDTTSPLAGAKVMVVESGAYVLSANDGSYELSGIDALSMTLRVSAEGYNSKNMQVQVPAAGTYTVDVALDLSTANGIRVLTLAVDKASYKAYEGVAITHSVQNVGATASKVKVTTDVVNAAEEVLDDMSTGSISLSTQQSTSGSAGWNTAQYAPGTYKVRLRVIKASENTDPYAAAVEAEETLATKEVFFTVEESRELIGSINLDPPVTLAEFQRPVAVKAAVRNNGNVPLSTGLKLTAVVDGNLVYEQEVSVSSLEVNAIAKLELGSFTPAMDGQYTVMLTPSEDTITADIFSKLLVGAHPEAEFTLDKSTTMASATKVRGTIKVSSSGLTNNETDEMMAIVKNAIQKGVNYEQVEVINWHNDNYKCNGCHIQTQAFAGLEASRDIVTIDESVTQTLFDTFVGWQYSNGMISGGLAASTYGLWAMLHWHDKDQALPYIIKTADYILSNQTLYGAWEESSMYPDVPYRTSTYYTSYNVHVLTEVYRRTGDERYMDAIKLAVNFLKMSPRTSQTYTLGNAYMLLGLQSGLEVVDDSVLLEWLANETEYTVNTIKQAQREDGGWKRWLKSDSLVTAISLYTLLKAGVPSDDIVVSKAVTFLLNSQDADGSWYSQEKVMKTRLAVTTWAMMALPLAFEKNRGIDSEVAITLSNKVDLSVSNPPATEFDGKAGEWTMTGVEEESSSLRMDFEVAGLEVGESRPIVQSATVSFNDKVTGDRFIVDLAIPTLTRVSPFEVVIATDKSEYAANEDVDISIAFDNVSTTSKTYIMDTSIVDAEGLEVASLGHSVETVFPAGYEAWKFMLPLEVTINKTVYGSLAEVMVDFNALFAGVGYAGEGLDENSLRLVEVDNYGEQVGEKKFALTSKPDGTYTLTWVMDGKSPLGSARRFNLYFNPLSLAGLSQSENRISISDGLQWGFFDNSYNAWDKYLYVGTANKSGTFTAPVKVMTTRYLVYGMGMNDFNNDGYTDITYGRSSIYGYGSFGDAIHIKLNKGDGSLIYGDSVMTEAGYHVGGVIVDFATGDFDGDGQVDAVTGGNKSNGIVLIIGNGHGGAIQKTTPALPSFGYMQGKSAVDIDGDGDLDVVGAIYSPYNYSMYPFGIYVYFNDGKANFTGPVRVLNTFGTYGAPNGLAAGDFDSDGKVDVIFAIQTTGKTYLMRGNGDGLSFSTPEQIGNIYWNQGINLKAGDLNFDGKLDLLVGITVDKKFYFYPGNGDGTFGNPTLLATATNGIWGMDIAQPRYKMQAEAGNAVMASNKTFNYVWNTGTTYAGNYSVKVRFSDQGGDELSDQEGFIITPGASLAASVVTDKASYSPVEDVKISSRISSQSLNYIYEGLSGVLLVNAPDGSVVFTDTFQIAQLYMGQTIDRSSYLDLASRGAGTYTAWLKVLDASGAELVSSGASFEVQSSAVSASGVTGALSVSAPLIRRGSPEVATYQVTNDGNVDLGALEAYILIVDPVSGSVAEQKTVTLSLPKGATVQDTLQMDTAALASAKYLAILRVKTAEMVEPKTLASATFEVEPLKLSGTLQASPLVVRKGSDVAFAYSATNEGKLSVDALGLMVVVRSLDTGATAMTLECQVTVAGGATITGVLAGSTATLAQGSYTATLTAKAPFEVETKTLASETFEVESLRLQGTLQVSPEVVRKGNEVAFAYSVTNEGKLGVDSLALRISVASVETGATVEREDMVDLPGGTTIAKGLSASTSNMAPGMYLATLTASTAFEAEPKALASASFEVKPSIESSKALGASYRKALVWLNYNWQGKGGVTPEVAVIEASLSASGVAYMLVYDKKDFQSELRNPFYTDYVILGDHHPLEGHSSDELMQKVYMGRGLVSSLFNRQDMDSDVFGIKYTGSLSGTGLELRVLDSVISNAVSIWSTGQVLRVEALAGSNVVAWAVDVTKKGEVLYPAAVTRSYGLGKVVYTAYDLGMSLSAEAQGFAPMLKSALDYAMQSSKPQAEEYAPYEFVPVRLTLTSLGDAISARVLESYPEGFRLLDGASGQWVADNPWQIDVQLGSGQKREIDYFALTPDRAGEFKLVSEVGYVEGAQYTKLENVELALSVVDTQTMYAKAEAAVASLSVPSGEVQYVTEAQAYISSARGRAASTPDDLEALIPDLAMSMASLRKITGTDTTAALMELGRLMESYESLWYLGLSK